MAVNRTYIFNTIVGSMLDNLGSAPISDAQIEAIERLANAITDPIADEIEANGGGAAGVVWRGAYNPATAYAVNDAVYHASTRSSYICIAPTTGNAPTNPTYWSLLAQGGDDGADGVDGVDGDTGPEGPQGDPGITIFRNTSNQTAVTGNTNNNKVLSILIPAGTVTVGSIITIGAFTNKPSGAAVTTLRVYVNTADSITSPAPTLISTSQTANNSQTFIGIRKRAIVKSATITQTVQAISNVLDDAVSLQGVFTNSNIDWTVDRYVIFAIQNSSSADSTTLSYVEIEIK